MNDLERPEKLAEVESIRGHELDPEEARARLKELLADPDDAVRAEAAAAVWEHSDDEDLVVRAIELSTNDSSPRVRAKAMTALGRVVYEGAISGAEETGYKPDPLLGEPSAAIFARVRDHLLAAAGDERRALDERRFALEGLGFLGDDQRVAQLIDAFWKRPELQARLSAVFSMGRSGNQRFQGPLQEALAGNDSELRLQAIWASGESELQPARDALVALARHSKSQEERIAAIEAIARLGGEAAAQVLLALAERDSDAEVREAAATGLEEIALLDAMDDEGINGEADEDE